MPQSVLTTTKAKPLLQSPQTKERNCMSCGERFESQHFGNRLCDRCRRQNDGGSMGISTNTIRNIRRASRA